MANTFASWDPASGISQNDFLYQQIAAQKMAGLGSWSGGLDAETSMRSMATDLAKSGITSLGQLGWDPKAEKLGWNGGARQVAGAQTGDAGYWDAGVDENDPTWGKYGAMINKDTGKALMSSYGERTTGNTWSGSYAGAGNTGFDLNFDAEGNPIFGTHGASSVQSKDWMPAAMLLAGGTMAAAPFLVGAAGAGGAGSGAFLGEGVASGVGAWDAAAGLGAGEMLTGGSALEQLALGGAAGDTLGTGTTFELANAGASAMTDLGTTSAAGASGLNGAFLGEGVTSGIPAWDAASTGASSGMFSNLSVNSVLKDFGLLKPDGTLNSAAAIKTLLSAGSGLYGMSMSADQRKMLEQAILASAPWTTSGGTAMAGEELKRAISGDLSNDPGFKLAQQAAARASSQQPGGMASSAAAMAALKYQNDRIAALSGPAGVGFNPGAGYQTAASGFPAASSLASSSLASIGFGTTSSQMPPWLQQFLIKNGMGA